MKPVFLTALVLGSALFGVSPAETQTRSVPVDVPPQQPYHGVELNLELRSHTHRALSRATTRQSASGEAPELAIGDRVVVCFQATRSGYVTLWNRRHNQPEGVIYPNQWSHQRGTERMHEPGATAAPVEAQRRYCIGEPPDEFALSVGGPPGEWEVYLHWSPTLDTALGPDDYPVIGQGARRSATASDHAGTTIRYEVGNPR